MNHCVDCGRPVTRGRSHKNTSTAGVHCLVCANVRVMRAWRYRSAVTKLRLKVKELEEKRHA